MSAYKTMIKMFEDGIVEIVEDYAKRLGVSLNTALKQLGVPKKTFFRYKNRNKI